MCPAVNWRSNNNRSLQTHVLKGHGDWRAHSLSFIKAKGPFFSLSLFYFYLKQRWIFDIYIWRSAQSIVYSYAQHVIAQRPRQLFVGNEQYEREKLYEY